MRRTGFTLVELLMVIAIIAVLAGLLIPLIGYAKSAAKNAKCMSQLGTIQAALAVFKDANSFYPEKHTSFTDAFTKPGGTGVDKYRLASEITSSDWTTVAQGLLEQLQTTDRDNFRDLSSLRDPFTGGGATTNVFRYRPAKYYPLKAGSPLMIDGDGDSNGVQLPPNPDSYQLWSAGADGRDQYGERINGKKSDDVSNWKSP